MKKIYMLLATVLLCLGQAVAEPVKAYLSGSSSMLKYIEFRDGGADGPVITPEKDDPNDAYSSDVIFIENGLWAKADPEATGFYISYTDYDTYDRYQMEIEDNIGFFPQDKLEEWYNKETGKTNGKFYLNFGLSIPRKVTIQVQDPSLIVVSSTTYPETIHEVEEGDNLIKLGEYDGLKIALVDDEELGEENPATKYRLTRYYNVTNGTEYTIDSFQSSTAPAYLTPEGSVVAYELTPASEFVGPKATIKVDVPEDISISVGGSYLKDIEPNVETELELPSWETELYISHKNGEDVYMVTINGNPIQDNGWGSFNTTIKDGDKVEVTVYPEAIDYTVTVSVVPEEFKDSFFDSVEIAGETSKFGDGVFTVRNGKTMYVYFNTEVFDLKAVTVNGVEQDVYNINSQLRLKVTEDTDVVFTVEKKPTYTIIVDIDNPEAVAVSLNWNRRDLVPGENVLEYTADGNYMVLSLQTGATYQSLSYVYDGEEETVENPSDYYTLYLDKNYSKITIRATPLVRDKNVVFYFDYTDDEWPGLFDYTLGSFRFSSQSGYSFRYKAGYNLMTYADVDLPFYWNAYFNETYGEPNYAYINGEPANNAGGYDKTSFYFGESDSTSWLENPNPVQDGDVIKCYGHGEPEWFAAMISGDGEAEFSVVKDLIVPVEEEDGMYTIYDLQGTEVELVPAEGKAIKVYVMPMPEIEPWSLSEDDEDDEEMPEEFELQPNEDGKYIIKLDSNKGVMVQNEQPTGVNGIFSGAASNDVYTLTGVCVVRNADEAQIKNLPAGIYVVGGKKIVKK